MALLAALTPARAALAQAEPMPALVRLAAALSLDRSEDLSHARRPGRMPAGNGTWCYMAPEQVRGGEIGAAADVWGLGIVLYAAALRASPLADLADELDVDDPQLHARLPALRRARPRLAAALTTLVDACLEPDPGDRPALDDALRRLYALS